MGGIYRGGQNLQFLGFFLFFSHNGKKRLVFSSNGQIRIQMIKFQFKQTNQKLPRYYRPPTPAAGGSADANARMLPPDPTPVRAVAPAPTRQ
jgi:hypothetical protein